MKGLLENYEQNSGINLGTNLFSKNIFVNFADEISDKYFFFTGVHIQEKWEDHCNKSMEKFNSAKCQTMSLD